MQLKSKLMDESGMKRALMRISHEIIERNDGCDNLCIIGIKRRGISLAQMLSANINSLGYNVLSGCLDITLYRDDLKEYDHDPTVNGTQIDFDITDKTVVLVDDVIYTGRTSRAAMEAIIAMGRPAKIQLAVLIDRGHRELPIRADYIGKNIPTSKNEVVQVSVPPFDDETCVTLWQK